jgi:hypothetical protein
MIGDVIRRPHEMIESKNCAAMFPPDEPRRDRKILVAMRFSRAKS